MNGAITDTSVFMNLGLNEPEPSGQFRIPESQNRGLVQVPGQSKIEEYRGRKRTNTL